MRFGVERRKSVCTKEWEVESENSLVILQCAGSRIWRKIEDNGVGDKKLLVARIIKDIGKYVDRYDICQRIKNRTEALAEKLVANEVPEKLWTHLIVDFITKLLLIAGKDVILVVCDKLSKMAYFVAITEGTAP